MQAEFAAKKKREKLKMQCNTDKNAIRALMKEKRKSQSKYERESKSRAICTAFTALEAFKVANSVCVYMSAFGEADTEQIIEECIKHKKDIAVPVVDGEDIYLCKYTDELVSGAFGIHEPLEKIRVDVRDIDLFAVPALAFDKKGGRVGFGKGYYDKLLSGAEGIKVGLLYEFQLAEDLPAEKHDILMDFLITEKQIIKCKLNERL